MIVETRHRLREWGKWACGGEPSLGSMFRSLFGRGGFDSAEMPAHIQEIDHIICTTPKEMKILLIKAYTTGGTIGDKAIRCGLDRHRFRRLLDRAEWYVNSRLDGLVAEDLQKVSTIPHTGPQNGFRIRAVRIPR